MTLQTRLVLGSMLEDPTQEWYGLELGDVVGLASGTVYPILARLEAEGWLVSSWEDPSVHEAEGRPRRRLYRLTPDGIEQARTALTRAERTGLRTGWVWRPAGTEGGPA